MKQLPWVVCIEHCTWILCCLALYVISITFCTSVMLQHSGLNILTYSTPIVQYVIRTPFQHISDLLLHWAMPCVLDDLASHASTFWWMLIWVGAPFIQVMCIDYPHPFTAFWWQSCPSPTNFQTQNLPSVGHSGSWLGRERKSLNSWLMK